MSKKLNPEGEPWQQACIVCAKVKCPKPEKVAEWMRGLVVDLHERLLEPDLQRLMSMRFHVASYEGEVQTRMFSWSWALQGVCFDCLPQKAPEMCEYLEAGECVHFDSMVRWSALFPREPAVSRVKVRGERGVMPVATIWSKGGLVVHWSLHLFRDNGWVVSHEATGMGVFPVPSSRARAIAAAEALLPVADWPKVTEEMAKDPDLSVRARAALAPLLATPDVPDPIVKEPRE